MGRIFHIVPGTQECANGMAVVATLLAYEQEEATVVDLQHGFNAACDKYVEEVWVHGMWLPKEWAACIRALKLGKRLVRMTHGSLSPVYLKHQSPLKKRFASPIEKWLLRHSDKIVATCEAEAQWIQTYLGKHCPPIVVTDIRRFFKLPSAQVEPLPTDRPVHLLYMGRLHPLKGVEFLEVAVRQISSDSSFKFPFPPQLKVVSNASGAEKERIWDWCDVLVLSTLSDNFGLVIAEALEHGKRVITTDGAPAWGDGNTYGNRLIYLRGYRDGSRAIRIAMLKDAILSLTTNHQQQITK